jgi:Pyruvate/2-oxoacid:ferredoxin oxidoreductase delta subunit
MTSVQIAQEPLNQAWETVLGVTNAQLNLLDESPILIEEKAMDAMLSRRAFFGSFQQEGRKLAKSMAPVSWRMEQDDWKLTKYYPDYQFFSVYIKKDQCTLCQACFSLCPENVFLLKEGELQIHNEKCVNCTSCTDVCPENAIEIIPDMQRKRECAEHIQLKTCKDCGHRFYTYNSETEKCHVCTNRDPNWLIPY